MSWHVAQGLSQNFVPKPTYLLELNLPLIKWNGTRLLSPESVYKSCHTSCWLTWDLKHKTPVVESLSDKVAGLEEMYS